MSPVLEQELQRFIDRRHPFREGASIIGDLRCYHVVSHGVEHRLAFEVSPDHWACFSYKVQGVTPGTVKPGGLCQRDDLCLPGREPSDDDLGVLALKLIAVNHP